VIRYYLVCAKGHAFESWFQNSDAFDRQAKRALIACPSCGSLKVEKALMTPQLARKDNSRTRRAAAASPETPQAAPAAGDSLNTPVAIVSEREREFRAKLKELRDHLTRNSDNVGQKFPEEARKMHYGEIEHRSIYGEASAEDAKALHEEGIEFHPLPPIPDDRN
jgi:hypothetical protein